MQSYAYECTWEDWLWIDLKSIAGDAMHSPVSIGVHLRSTPPSLMHSILNHMFHFTAQLDAHRWPSMLGYCHGTPDSTLRHFHGTIRLMQLTMSDVKNHIGPNVGMRCQCARRVYAAAKPNTLGLSFVMVYNHMASDERPHEIVRVLSINNGYVHGGS